MRKLMNLEKSRSHMTLPNADKLAEYYNEMKDKYNDHYDNLKLGAAYVGNALYCNTPRVSKKEKLDLPEHRVQSWFQEKEINELLQFKLES